MRRHWLGCQVDLAHSCGRRELLIMYCQLDPVIRTVSAKGCNVQPPLYGCKASPMNGAGQPLESTFPKFPKSVKRSLFVAIVELDKRCGKQIFRRRDSMV